MYPARVVFVYAHLHWAGKSTKLVTFDTVDCLKPTDKDNLTESVSLIVRLTLYNENFKIFNKRKKKINNKAICVFFFSNKKDSN